jgi:pimeloyl-ACP methyl ester carboxylesterase
MAEMESSWGQWTHPTLIVWGMKDPWLPFAQAQNFTNSVKNAELVQLENAGHYPQEHFPGDISDALVPFLRRTVV